VRLYSGTSDAFDDDVTNARLVPKLITSFKEAFGWEPGEGEKSAWRNSLEKARNLIVSAKLHDRGVLLEYVLPASDRRLDFLISGRDAAGRESAVVIELKQWTETHPSPLPTAVETKFHGTPVDHLHPSVQVGQYHEYLQDFQAVFHGGDAVLLNSCAFLHNYNPGADDALLNSKFDPWLLKYPVFFERDFDAVKAFLNQHVGGGPGIDTLHRIEESRVEPSEEFVKHLGDVLGGRSEFKLLDEQRLVYDRVLTELERALSEGRKSAVIAKGGPGTGKTVIAVNLLAQIIKRRSGLAHFVTGSGAFTRTLRQVIDPSVGRLFKFTNNYVNDKPDSYAALIVDEAHRMRPFSTSYTGRRTSKEGVHQVDEILAAGRVSVFFIDDLQGITPQDAGKSSYIRARAKELGIQVHEYKLSIQFRCRGAEAFVGWLDSTLGLSDAEVPRWRNPPGFEFRIFDSASEMQAAIRRLNSEGKRARLTAGYCWRWSPPKPDGTLENDVSIGGLVMPWNAKEGRSRAVRLAPGIPPAQLWAYSAGGENQIGCVYTAQGFEFDTVGVIFGRDLRFDRAALQWVGEPTESKDRKIKVKDADFTSLVKRCYRVLLTRGIERCFVYFADPDTRAHFESRMITSDSQPPG
jgi:uncharacterized protein